MNGIVPIIRLKIPLEGNISILVRVSRPDCVRKNRAVTNTMIHVSADTQSARKR